jgi:ATP-dependent RNA helicase RhlB
MFDLGFIKDIRFLLRRMPPREQRQSMLFSATLSHRVLELAYEHMNSPEKLTVETESVTASRVRQVVYFPAKEEKLPLLIGLLSRIDAHRSIVFVNTKIAAEKVTRALEHQGHTVATLSGDVPQAKRERLLNKFQRGEIEMLVATDVAARGLHIPDVSHVFNYDLPHDAEDYVHRIGRTARLGAEGDAISFACDLYAMALPDIEAYIEQKIPVERIEADILVAPPRRERAKAADEDTSADDARNTAGALPQKSASSRSRGPRQRDGRSGDRGPRRERAPRSEAPRAHAEAPVAAEPNAPAPVTTPNGATLASGDAPKKRRRRGGRGRNKHRTQGEAANATPASRNDASKPANAPRREHPNRERPSAPPRAAAPAASAPVVEPKAAKPGFFGRIARMFSLR